MFWNNLGEGPLVGILDTNERIEPPRSTRDTMARFCPGPTLPPLVGGGRTCCAAWEFRRAEVGFVGLNDLALAHWSEIAVAHRFADTMAYKPCSFERYAKDTMQLICAHALFAGG